jgi:replicative DNA helicase
MKIAENILTVAKKMVNPDLGLKTGFPELDNMTLGFHDTDLIVVAGRPSMGKSAFAIQLALQMGVPVNYYSLEMSNQIVGERLISLTSGVCYYTIKSGKMSKDQKDKANKAVKDLQQVPILVEDENIFSPEDIAIHFEKNPAKCIFIDHLHLAKTEVYGNENEKLGRIVQDFKEIGKHYEVPVVLACQLNREAEKRERHEPRMSDLQGCGKIEQVADLIMMLHRPSYYEISEEDIEARDDQEAWVYLVKNRNGPVGKTRFVWNKFTMSFTEQVTGFRNFGG